MSNEDARRRRLLQRRVCAVVLAGVSALLIALFFLPYVTFELSKVTYQFTSLQLVTSFMTVKGTAVSMSLITKAAAVLPLLLAAAGGVLIWLRKPVAAAVCYILVALCALTAMMSINAMSSQFVDIGVGSIHIGFHFPLAVQLGAGILAAMLAMWTKGGEKLAESVFLVFACMSVGSVAIITIYMITVGAPAIGEIGLGNFLFGTEWSPGSGKYGIWHMILASFAGMFGAIVIGVPIGLLTAVFLAELAPRRLANLVRPAIELLAGIPSVIYGFFGMMVLVPFLRRVFPGTVGDSLLAMIGRWIAPIFVPLGFSDWRVSTALISGFTAKEAVVSTLSVLTGAGTAELGNVLTGLFTPLAAVSFLIFTLLYTPCVAAIATIKNELHSRTKAFGVVVMQCTVAWVCACLVYQIGCLFM
mgnify:CR=1 FL=1